MNNMIALIRPGPQLEQLSRCLLILGASYGVPICSYQIFDLDPEKHTVPALMWKDGELTEKPVEIPAFSEFFFSRLLAEKFGDLESRINWLKENTTITDNKALSKDILSRVLICSPLSIYAIPTYNVHSPAQLKDLSSVIPNGLIKPSGGRKGLGVLHIHHHDGSLIIEDRNGKQCFTDTFWNEYQSFLKNHHLGQPIFQPRLNFSLDESHAVDFRLLVARGITGDWETVAIYPRIGATHLVSNVAQGGYIGDAEEVLQRIAGEEAPRLMKQLEQIAYELPTLIQKHCPKPVTVFGLDVGIDRDSLQPFILEANRLPSTKLHTWHLAEKKIQYYKYLLSQA